ncbi:MAG: hypothetical protein KTV77_00200 [Wolbachia endosymbiont of Fragariocoptes setiger]|nr:hypothetical protein [Wolbachia endosymbiont of Fragariocoptes setiger]
MDILNSEFTFHDILAFEEGALLYEDDQGEVKLCYVGENSFNTDISIPMQFKSYVSLVSTDGIIGVVVPEVEINEKQEEYIKGFSFNMYDSDGNLLPRKAGLYKYSFLDSNEISNNKYFHSQVNQVNDYVFVIANNFADKAAVAWLLKQEDHGVFIPIPADKSVTERQLFRLNDRNTVNLY